MLSLKWNEGREGVSFEYNPKDWGKIYEEKRKWKWRKRGTKAISNLSI
jgi:hypothetical protein